MGDPINFSIMPSDPSVSSLETDPNLLALRIRAFELKLLDLFSEGKLSGTVHTCVGQELCATTLHPHLDKNKDAFFATHRGHGHYLAYGGPIDGFLAELTGKEGAICGGRGGTQHLHYCNFFSSGIQGGTGLLATGFAWAIKRRGGNGIAVAQLGDGTLGEGATYEAFTFATQLKVPVLFLIEHNGYAQSTDTSTTISGDLKVRMEGFGLKFDRRSDGEPQSLHHHLGKVVQTVRNGEPFVQIIDTNRLMPHSKGDDDRPKPFVKQLWENDYLNNLIEQSPKAKLAYSQIQSEINEVAEEILSRQDISFHDSAALVSDGLSRNSRHFHADLSSQPEPIRIVNGLNDCLHEIMSETTDVVLIGEDLLDPYGGAFKVTIGLSTKYPERVFSTPIAEAGIIGVANGLALAGMRPIAEIMFADFLTLASDQIINHAAKFFYMYNNQVTCPITIRTPSGGGRGYGPTHSQSLEKIFGGIPGLRIVALSQRHQAGFLLKEIVLSDDNPTLFIEHKLLYAKKPPSEFPVDLVPNFVESLDSSFPPLCYIPANNATADVTIVTYGGLTELVESMMQKLIYEEELRFDYFIITQISPLEVDNIVQSVLRTRKLVVAEENVPQYGFGDAVISRLAQEIADGFSCRVVGAKAVPIPSSRKLEDEVLPNLASLTNAVLSIL